MLSVWINVYNTHKAFEWRKKFFENDDPEDDSTADQLVYNNLKNNARNKDKVLTMKKLIKEINENQHINNNNAFKYFKAENSVVVIQVHSDIRYLAVLLDSIRRVIGITRSLIIFCHDYYDDRINNVIRNITFAKVMQIFYPYSIQLHPNIYPGKDSQTWDAWTNDENANTPRNKSLAQKKLFWWWIMNKVFDDLEVVKSYNGFMYFLETELYVASDTIFIAKMMEHLRPVYCPDCMILALGAHRPTLNNYPQRKAKIVASTWGWANFTNAGFGMNRTLWKFIKKYSKHFCYFNDYGWDYSLRYLASKTPNKQFFALSPEGPRVFPTSGCGLYSNGTRCNLNKNYVNAAKFVWTVRKGLFPHNFDVKHEDVIERNADLGRGEFLDGRDREMCMFLASTGRREYY